jgi:hypothetical protein
MRLIPVLAVALFATGCYATRDAAVSQGRAQDVLKQHGYGARSIPGGIESTWEWQRPNNAQTILAFGLTFTRHRVVEGKVTSETYGWSLIPGILLPFVGGFLVNLPVPMEDQVHQDLTTKPL